MRPAITEVQKIERETTLKRGDFVTFENGDDSHLAHVANIAGKMGAVLIPQGNFWSGPVEGCFDELTSEHVEALFCQASNVQILDPAEVPAAIAKALGVAAPDAKPATRYFVSLDEDKTPNMRHRYWYIAAGKVRTIGPDGDNASGSSEDTLLSKIEKPDGYREVSAPPF